MNRLLAGSGIFVLVAGLYFLIMPGPPIPLLDANRVVLAESEREGFCAGDVYFKTNGMGSEEGMAECIATSTIDNEINHRRVQPAFCAGIITAGLNILQADCMGIMEARQFWPTEVGGLTSSWNRRFPYPGAVLTVNQPVQDESRTGDREVTDREDGLR